MCVGVGVDVGVGEIFLLAAGYCDWGIKHEACACLLSKVGVVGLIGTWGQINNN